MPTRVCQAGCRHVCRCCRERDVDITRRPSAPSRPPLEISPPPAPAFRQRACPSMPIMSCRGRHALIKDAVIRFCLRPMSMPRAPCRKTAGKEIDGAKSLARRSAAAVSSPREFTPTRRYQPLFDVCRRAALRVRRCSRRTTPRRSLICR